MPTTIERLMMMGPGMYVAMLAGPSVAGLLMTSLVSGRAGLREVLVRLTTWRVGGRWYPVALLTAARKVMITASSKSVRTCSPYRPKPARLCSLPLRKPQNGFSRASTPFFFTLTLPKSRAHAGGRAASSTLH
jgi:hypothetical protein